MGAGGGCEKGAERKAGHIQVLARVRIRSRTAVAHILADDFHPSGDKFLLTQCRLRNFEGTKLSTTYIYPAAVKMFYTY